MEPVQKRFSVWERPDTGSVWPEQFDAITIKQEVARTLTAKELRRWIDNFYDIPHARAADHLYGVVVHRETNEGEAAVILDTGKAYRHVSLVVSAVVGTKEYGYDAVDIVQFGENQIGTVDAGDYLTYFSVQQDFVPIQGELLGMMIAALRDKLRK